MFQDGKLQYGSSNDPREKLGQLLVRRQLISEAQLCSALARQEQTGIQLGVLLVSQGRLRADELCRTLRAKVEAIVYELFLWTDGGFVFKEGALGGVPIQAKLDTRKVVEEGQRRRKRTHRIRESFGDYDVRFDALVDTPAPARRARASSRPPTTCSRSSSCACCGCARARPASHPRNLQRVLLDLVVERAPRDAKHLRGPHHVAALGGEHVFDVAALHVLERAR